MGLSDLSKIVIAMLLQITLMSVSAKMPLPQAAAQQNTSYSCTVEFVPANLSTDRMAGWEATARASVVLPASHRVSGSVIQKSPDKRVADAACRDFFAERARHQSPAEDTALGK